jgi:hypothetical protein
LDKIKINFFKLNFCKNNFRKNEFCKNKILKLFFLFCLTCFFSFNVFAVDFEETFLKANDFYNNKKYKEALDLYKSMGCKGPVTLYNIGNCEFRLGKYLEALINWSKAKKNSSFDLLNSINHNIYLANYRLGISKVETIWQRFVDIINLFPLFKLQVLFLFFWFLFFISYIFLRKLRFIFLIINMFFILVFGLFVFVKYRLEKYPVAISKSAAGLFYGPSENYHKVSDISVAEKVEVKKVYKSWCKIKYNGITGWVLSSNLEII